MVTHGSLFSTHRPLASPMRDAWRCYSHFPLAHPCLTVAVSDEEEGRTCSVEGGQWGIGCFLPPLVVHGSASQRPQCPDRVPMH